MRHIGRSDSDWFCALILTLLVMKGIIEISAYTVETGTDRLESAEDSMLGERLMVARGGSLQMFSISLTGK